MIYAEELLKLPKLGKDDTFAFGCTKCGKCCRERDDILLTPLDLFKISKYLNQTIQEVLVEYCESYEGSESKIPIVRLKPKEYRKTCPFASKEGCRIHPVKPAVCALYPLGRMTNWETKEFTYFLQPVPCGNRAKIQTVRQWLEDFSILDEEEFTMLWHQKIGEISEILREIYQERTFNHDPVNAMLMKRLYMCYELNKDFLDQFRNNCTEALQMLTQISKISNV